MEMSLFLIERLPGLESVSKQAEQLRFWNYVPPELRFRDLYCDVIVVQELEITWLIVGIEI